MMSVLRVTADRRFAMAGHQNNNPLLMSKHIFPKKFKTKFAFLFGPKLFVDFSRKNKKQWRSFFKLFYHFNSIKKVKNAFSRQSFETKEAIFPFFTLDSARGKNFKYFFVLGWRFFDWNIFTDSTRPQKVKIDVSALPLALGR